MKHVLSRRKKNNSGSTIIIVLLMTSFVLILATLITTTTMVNYRMKLAGSQSSKSFYTAEEAVDEIQAALGKVSVECFNQAYEEQLTKVLSTTKINGSEVVSAIDNKTANVEFRQNYTNKLMPKILDLTPLGTATKDQVEKLVEDGYSTASGKVIPTPKAGVLLGRWTNDITAEKQKKVCDNFVAELNKYIEDKNSLAADNKVLQVMSVNDLKYYVTAGTTANTTDLPVYTIKFSDCIVKYMDKATGSYSYITFNGSVGLPDIYINFKEDEKVGTLFFCDYSLVGNKGITLTDGTASISGSAYAGKGTGTGLTIKNAGSKLNFKGKYLVCGGSVNLDSGNLELGSSSQLWAMDINVGDNSEFTADGGSKINLEDDLTVDGDNSTVNINDGCYYYGFGYEDGDTAKERPDFSSAIIVNGLNSHVKFGSLGKLYIAGRAYIKFASDRSLATGESISVNTNQGIYLVPTKLMDKGSKNPTIKDDSATTFSATISIDNFFGYYLLDSSDKYISKEYENKTDGKTRVYYYLNFANSYARNQYTKIIYGSDTDLENYLKTLSYYNGLSTADKATYLDEAEELRDYIKGASTAFGTTNSDITGIDYNASGTYSNELDDSNADDYREVFVDRDNRYSVFNKILAPLKRDDNTPYGNGEIQTELSQIDSKYTFINLSRYTPGDVFGNIINEDAFNKFTSEEGKSTADKEKAFLRSKDSKNIIVAHVGLGSKIVLKSGSSLNQDKGSNIITIPESGGYCNGVVICDGDVEVDCNFNGIILADGIVTVKSGCEVKNDLFNSSISTSDSKSFWYFVENHKNDDDMKAPNKYSNDIGFKDIFRYWNSGSESDASGGTLSLDNLSYKDMVLFTQWRKYEDISNNPEQTEPEESSSSS